MEDQVVVGTGGLKPSIGSLLASRAHGYKFWFVAAAFVVGFLLGGGVLYGLWQLHSTPQEDKMAYDQTIADASDAESKGKTTEAAQSLMDYAENGKDAENKAYARTLAGAIYEKDGDLPNAIAAYEDGKDLPASHGGLSANEGLARLETKQGNKAQAIEYWKKCIELKNSLPDDPLKKLDIETYQRYITALGG